MNTPNTLIAAQPAATLPINSVQDLQTLGAILAQSSLFGKRNPAEGLAIVAMCQQKRISWLDFMQNFHMIQGVVSKKADAMLADLHRIGGTYKILSRTDKEAKAIFKNGETEYPSSVLWEDCLKEPFVYVGKESDVVAMLSAGNTPPLKSKYSTPRARMQMLWARCVSDGVRVVAPECVQGIYTPEETDDFVNEISPAAPTVVNVSESPLSPSTEPCAVDVCPVGKFKGVKWGDIETPALQLALSTTGKFITTEMKDHIRGVLKDRESGATAITVAEVNKTEEVNRGSK